MKYLVAGALSLIGKNVFKELAIFESKSVGNLSLIIYYKFILLTTPGEGYEDRVKK